MVKSLRIGQPDAAKSPKGETFNDYNRDLFICKKKESDKMYYNGILLKEIPDFTGYYASKDGKIYSTLAPGCRNRYDLTKRIKPKELNYRKTKSGYCRVYMRRESINKREDLYVHRIIAELFIPNPFNLSDVNHKDNNPLNNKVDNLEWLSHKNNLEYGFTHGHKSRNILG